MDNLQKKFPSYFNSFILPEGAKEESITVYRACKTQNLDKDSFLPSFEENGFQYGMGDDHSDPSVYSLSTYEKPKDVKRFANTNCHFRKPYKIAIGNTEPLCGLSQRTKARKEGYKSSHIDWWLYENAKPYKYFELIQNFDEYFSDYKKERGIK